MSTFKKLSDEEFNALDGQSRAQYVQDLIASQQGSKPAHAGAQRGTAAQWLRDQFRQGGNRLEVSSSEYAERFGRVLSDRAMRSALSKVVPQGKALRVRFGSDEVGTAWLEDGRNAAPVGAASAAVIAAEERARVTKRIVGIIDLVIEDASEQTAEVLRVLKTFIAASEQH
ncbi:hypothetical protein [Gibbsiella quercinecans]|uniref:hypothetical protein n=1 Tax=Gibbsiella quercinecans TaxID=929813 RepID=UPI00243194AF|nr:hypothetical protein [Gibbsiella quercinecans]